jgi:hypothetical protein
MFGWFNDCAECLVVYKFDEETWRKVKVKANCEVADGGFLRYKYYPDSDTVQLFVAASEVLGVTVDELLQAFGEYFIHYVQENGYSNVLECLGSNLRDWLSNLNSLHDHLQASYPKGFVAPVFWSEDDPDSLEGGIFVHYFSRRGSLLVPFVVGAIKKIALRYFDIEINMAQLQLQDDDANINSTSWRVTAVDPEEAYKLRRKRTSRNGLKDDDTCSTVTPCATAANKYGRTFREGGTQAAYLRVEEFVKRSFYNEDCELFHALTLEQYIYLVDYWKSTKVDGKWCYEMWSIQDDDPKSWASLQDLPSKLNPETIDTSHFGGKVPKTGEYPPGEKGTIQSFLPKVRIVNQASGKFMDLILTKESDLTLKNAIYNTKQVQEAGLTEFPELEERIQNHEFEIQFVVWNDKTNSAYHTFALGDLNTTSTQQLYEFLPKTFDPIKIVVQCTEAVCVDDDEEDI